MSNPNINLHKLTIEELNQLRTDINHYLSMWFGFSPEQRKARTQEWIDKAKWRLEGQTEPCCNCGDDYPRFDLHFGGEIYCPKCRETSKG